MTTVVMQVAGKAHANSAAAALNANRQIGALVGVALMGAILHSVDGWSLRNPLAFGVMAAGLWARCGWCGASWVLSRSNGWGAARERGCCSPSNGLPRLARGRLFLGIC
jgi:hypothetical protein